MGDAAVMTAAEVQGLVARTLPSFYTSSPRFLQSISDHDLALLLPILIYWGASLAYHALDVIRPAWSEKYRLHAPEELEKRNRVSMKRVIAMVAFQHAIQTALGIAIMEDTPATKTRRLDADPFTDIPALVQTMRSLHLPLYDSVLVRAAIALYWWGIPWLQFWFACFVLDAWQYMLHRTMHEVRFLYRTMHSHHHRLYVPYAFGALYNHPLEGMLLDTLGTELARVVSRMTLRQTMVFFTLSTFKTVCDHGGYAFPWYFNPIHALFPNNAAYHDVHHQTQGLRYNYSQPFFVHFDTILGTRVDPEDFHTMLEKKGLQTRKIASAKNDNEAEEENARPARLPVPKRSSPYSTATVWSSVLFMGILAVPVLVYSVV